MTKEELLKVLRDRADAYSQSCDESVRRNKHMNQYDGSTPVAPDAARAWLDGFCVLFSERYEGPKVSRDVISGMVMCARTWRTRPGLEGVSQDGKDAVVVDFVNYVAANHCGMDLGLYAVDLGRPEAGDAAYA